MECLTQRNQPALIACPIRGRTGGTRALCRGNKSYRIRHTFRNAKRSFAADLALQVQYIQMLEEMVAAAVRDRRPMADVLGCILPAPFDAWQRLGIRRFAANVRSLYERQSL